MTLLLQLRLLGPAIVLLLSIGSCGDSPNSSGNCDEECQNGGTCEASGDAYTCVCPAEVAGQQCELTPCEGSPCQNGGTCTADNNNFVCACEDGFGGETCDAIVGLNERPNNGTCFAPALPANMGPLSWQAAGFSGLSDNGLMMIAQAPDTSWYEIYRGGEVYRVAPNGVRSSAPLLNIDASEVGEMGLLGLAIHPDFPAEPYLYFYYGTFAGNSNIHVDQYTVSPATGGPDEVSISSASRRSIFSFDRGSEVPFHVGGSIGFDPNASTPTLYLATGDADNQNESQNLGSMLGKLLRFDLSDPNAASFPPEVVARGLRNPFRWNFDRQTGDMWIADVGDSTFEEVTFVPASDIPGSGGTPLNFGWPIMEGFLCVGGGDPANSCGNTEALYLPANTYGRELGASVIGGFPYRGASIGGIDGVYFYNDFYGSAFRLDENPTEDPGDVEDDFLRVTLSSGGGFVGYAEDRNGELFAMNMGGEIFTLVAEQVGPVPEVLPALLSEVGCFDEAGEPLAAMIPFEVHAPLWSDGATKRRWLALPNDTSISIGDRGDFEFPVGTVLAKEFRVDGVRVETRLFMRHPNGDWRGYTYAWVDENEALASDAALLTDLAVVTRSVPGTVATWSYPTRSQCLQCHTRGAGFSLGPEVGQLNYDFSYPLGIEANQLTTLAAIGIVDGDIAEFAGQLLPAYDDVSTSVSDRAWSYMHTNCAGCHQPGEAGYEGRSNMPDLRYDLTVDTSSATHPLVESLCGLEAGAGDLGLPALARIVEPGRPGDWSDLDAGGSLLYFRMAARPSLGGTNGTMPQLGSELVDQDVGLPLIHQWISEMVCP